MLPRLFHIALFLLLLGSHSPASEPRPSTDVAIARFTAARFRDLITLNWNTLAETNNLGFEIERRSQFDTHWQTVAYLRGRGSETVGERYSYVEQVAAHTVVFYRLKQIDVSGRALYTPAVTVTPEHFETSIRVSSVQRKRTIAYDQVSLALPQAGMVRIRVFDTYGRELRELAEERVLPAGFHVLPFQSSALARGVYSVRLETAAGTLVELLTRMD